MLVISRREGQSIQIGDRIHITVVRIDDRIIGAGKPGPVTRKLLHAYRERARQLTRKAEIANP